MWLQCAFHFAPSSCLSCSYSRLLSMHLPRLRMIKMCQWFSTRLRMLSYPTATFQMAKTPPEFVRPIWKGAKMPSQSLSAHQTSQRAFASARIPEQWPKRSRWAGSWAMSRNAELWSIAKTIATRLCLDLLMLHELRNWLWITVSVNQILLGDTRYWNGVASMELRRRRRSMWLLEGLSLHWNSRCRIRRWSPVWDWLTEALSPRDRYLIRADEITATATVPDLLYEKGRCRIFYTKI